MKTLTLPISVPEGMEIDTIDQASKTIIFKEKTKARSGAVTERIKSVDDAIEELGENHSEVIIYRAMLTALGTEDHPVKQQEIILITRAMNEGWLPDWSDSSQGKYYPWFEMRGASGFRYCVYDIWHSISNVGSRLCFKSRQLAEHAGRTFTEVYKQFMIIN